MNLLKPVKKIGNSGGVHLPAAWIGGEVEVRLVSSPLGIEKISERIMNKLIGLGAAKNIEALFITGSVAREEADKGSDIDIVLVYNGEAKKAELIKKRLKTDEGNYDIIIGTEKEFREGLKKQPAYYCQMLADAKAGTSKTTKTPVDTSAIRKDLCKSSVANRRYEGVSEFFCFKALF